MRVNAGEAVRQTATIYQFPLQRRVRPAPDRNDEDRPIRSASVMSSSWYHDEAIEDARRGH